MLLGLEGRAAQLYFANFSGLIKPDSNFDFEKRVRRPATDPVNSVLSFCYALLTKDILKVLLVVGLDPYRGIYHTVRPARPGLALDLAEEFRSIIADSVTITVFNNKILAEDDFLQLGTAVVLKDLPKRTLVAAYERRMDTLVTHPIFGYKVSYRRVIEIQARLLMRTMSGEISKYTGFTTR